MININTDIIKIQQLDSSLLCKTQKEVPVTDAQIEKTETKSVELKLSQEAMNQINSLITKEDSLIIKFNKAQTIYEQLSDIRLKLKDLLDIIKDPEMRFDKEDFDLMESMSNSLIESTIKIVRNNDDMNIIDPKLMNVYINGLSSIGSLNYLDNDYLSKLESIDTNVKAQENEYLKATETLYSKLIENQKKFETLIKEKTTISDSKNIDKQIIENAQETLKSSTANISREAVLRLLQG